MKQWRRRAYVAQYGTLKGLKKEGKEEEEEKSEVKRGDKQEGRRGMLTSVAQHASYTDVPR